MTRITARVSHELAESLQRYVEDFDDLSVALERRRDPADPVLDWDAVRGKLLA